MIFLVITGLVLAVLAYSYVELRNAYGARTLIKLFVLTILYFFVKELLQSRNLLLNHYYHTNHVVWVEILGVPPFVVFGHLFVVVMTWQLANQYMHRLGLAKHPVVFLTLVFYFTAGISMLMENTGVVGGWWTWAMPSWWFYPNILGAPLVGLPWDRPITSAWGYFISTYWLVLLVADVARPWKLRRAVVALVALGILLELSRVSPIRWLWGNLIMPALPFISVLAPSAHRTPGTSMWILPTGSRLLDERPYRWNGAVALGIVAMMSVCVMQIALVGKWLALVSLFPIGVFAIGSYLTWPPWIDCACSLAMMLVGYRMNNGNLILAGWIVFRCRLMIWVLLAVVRRRERKGSTHASSAARA